jgi:hypothetical protein
MLVGIGSVAAWQMRSFIAENPWFAVPSFAVLVFAGVMLVISQRPEPNAKRRGQLFGVGVVALLASAVFTAFVLGFIRQMHDGVRSLDIGAISAAPIAGALAGWRWFRFVRLVREKE